MKNNMEYSLVTARPTSRSKAGDSNLSSSKVEPSGLGNYSTGRFVSKEKTIRFGKIPHMYVRGFGGGFDEGPSKQKRLEFSIHTPLVPKASVKLIPGKHA
jgi:hypothetical protein